MKAASRMLAGVLLLLSSVLSLPAAAAVAAATNSPYLAWLATQLPQIRRDGGYVGSAQCRECHADEHASWHRSYHRTMTQPATEEAVLGKFDGTTIDSGGLSYRVFRDGDKFMAEMPDPDVMMYVIQGGRDLALERIPRVKLPVVMATGSHHYQTYWVASPRYPGLLQTLPLVYLKEGRRWIPREAAFLRGPGDRERMMTQWNHHCIRCHSTGGNPGLDEKGRLKSKVAELGIACEACHGPGEAHVGKHRVRAELKLPREETADPTIVNPKRLDHERATHVCGQCHGAYVMRDESALEFARQGPLFKPGEDLFRTRYYMTHPGAGGTAQQREDLARNPEFYATRWWEDGTILAGGREFTAMLASACYTRGTMSCISCHSMHDSDPNDQLKRGRDGPAACTQCHREPQYTTDLRRHTFHAPESSGSDCLNCHMPHTTYALFKSIRSHQITLPRVEPSARHGVPNACNLCHLDRPLAWTQEHLVKWFEHREVPLSAEHRETAASLLWLLQGHAAQRIVTAWHFGWEPAHRASGTNWLAPVIGQALADSYPQVRFVAARALRSLPGFGELDYDFLATSPAHTNAVRSVREQWSPSAEKLPANPAVLLREGGRLDEARLAEILSRQDRRRITVEE